MALALFLGSSGIALGAGHHGCPPRWVETFAGEDGGVSSGGISAMLAWDDGSGPAIYAAGRFTEAGGQPAHWVAKWDGEEWSPLGAGLSGLGLIAPGVLALAVYDDGDGEALYAAGRFSHSGETEVANIAKWTGTAWVPLGPGLNNTVYALTVFDGGNGPALYAGGVFSTAANGVANRVANWNGTAWSNMEGVASINALAVYDDGNGPALYAGGTAGGAQAANRLTRWEGDEWVPIEGLNGSVNTLGVFDGGEGPELLVAGGFTQAGDEPANRIARWNGQAWSALGEGIGGNTASVHTLGVYDDGMGGGSALFAGGNFDHGDPVRRKNIAKWDGERWWVLHAGVGAGSSSVRAMTVFDDGSGPALFVGGSFDEAGLIEAQNIAKWQGCDYQPLCEPGWAALGSGIGPPGAQCMEAFDDGSGPALYVGGGFFVAGGVEVSHIARWDGHQWFDVGGGMSGTVNDLVVFDDGSGPALYAGGDFHQAGGVSAWRVAKWDGVAWTALGGGIPKSNERVTALAVFDDGNGPALYAGGRFSEAGGEAINLVAKWDGQQWSALGEGFNDHSTFTAVNALKVFDDGNGPALYVGGNLPGIVGVANTQHIARWDGQQWSAVGDGFFGGQIGVLEEFDSGNGPELYAGGSFSSAQGVADTQYIAKWDGQQWRSITPQIQSFVTSFAVWDDGTGGGPALFVGGGFQSVDYKETGEIAKWDGTNWWSIDGVERIGAVTSVNALAVFDDGLGHGPVLYVGGRFLSAGGVEVNRIARYGCGLGFAGPGTPALATTIAPSGQLRITWPQDNRLWILESASAPTTSQGTPVDADVVDQEGQFWSVDLPMDAQTEFFWLRSIE